MRAKIPWEYADLIAKKWSDGLNPEEEQLLQQWVDASAENRILYERVVAGEKFADYQQKALEHDFQSAYEAFRLYAKTRRHHLWKRWGMVAAILIPFALGIGLYFQKDVSIPLSQSEEICPGKYQAVLTLADGSELFLSSSLGQDSLKQISAVVHSDTLIYEKSTEKFQAEFHKITIPRGGEYMLKLADGTRVWLNAETELKYPVAFTGHQRKVYLKGEAYFEVVRDSLHPFVVATGEQEVTVLGTTFAIRAYAEEKEILTTLETGKVNVRVAAEELTLHPGQQSCFSAGHLTVETVNTSLYTAWHKGIFIFQNEFLEDILITLSRWYNIEVFYAQEDLKHLRFTGELLRYDRIQDFLNRLELLEKVRFTIKDRTVTVSAY